MLRDPAQSLASLLTESETASRGYGPLFVYRNANFDLSFDARRRLTWIGWTTFVEQWFRGS